MTEIQVTVSSRALERFVFIVIIAVLLVFVIKDYVEDRGLETDETSDDVDTGSGSDSGSANATEETCDDGVKNQDETNVDCGGTCGGYWYEGSWHDYQMECRLPSDCVLVYGSGYKCEDYKCVELPPECANDEDCGTGKECVDGQCKEKQLSNKITVSIDDVDTSTPTAEDTAKVNEVKFTIDNGKASSIALSADIYVYESTSDVWFNIKQDTIYFPSIASGETWSKYIKVDGKIFSESNEQKTLKAIFDSDEVGTITKRFTPS